ncbi:MAG: hypothetical protein QOF78_3736 [Phycisphaerales bacterium]|jgi:hypothetical protein|nr:hypothetical protein [Phycisphaerales bacterium]
MIGRRRVMSAAVGLFVAAVAIGCDDRSGSTAPAPGGAPPVTTAPITTGPATTASAIEAVATQPATSLMNINGHLTVFPPARLRLESDGQNVIALLYSDDPREALKSNYTGNSFYLRMVLDITDPEKLPDATWTYTAPSSGDREADSPYGVFLGGRKIALQPFKVNARFRVEGDAATALLMGNFQVLDDTPGRGPAQVLPVSAELPVKIDADSRASK